MTQAPVLYCYTTRTLVEENGMRPGYDCRCTNCMKFVAIYGVELAMRPRNGRVAY